MSDKKIVIIGGGPVGLLIANVLQACGHYNYDIIEPNTTHGFDKNKVELASFHLTQRTLFYDEKMKEFINKYVIPTTTIDLSKDNAVYYKGRVYDYPIQNSASQLPISDRWSLYWSHLLRDKHHNGDYESWAYANYGKWMAENILLPHTWKTLRENLKDIDSTHYGKKVVPFQKSKPKQLAFDNSSTIMQLLREKVSSHLVTDELIEINVQDKQFSGHSEVLYKYDIMFNTIPIYKFVKCVYHKDDTMQVSVNSLSYNNMLCVVFVVPTNMVNSFGRKILYFPEKKYVFSKVNVNRNNGYTAISCECSYRMSDSGKFDCQAYIDRFCDKVLSQLTEAKLVVDKIVSVHQRFVHRISPCYIITDTDYYSSNSFIQTYLEHYDVYNVGRFAQWNPSIRLEHSFHRTLELCEKLLRMVP